MGKNATSSTKTQQIQSITKQSIQNYLNEKLDFLNKQKSIHISKREGCQNLVYLNAQTHFIVQMQENLKLEY